MRVLHLLLWLMVFKTSTVSSQEIDSNIKKTEIHYTSKAPKIDGDVKGKEWRKAKWSNPFVDISDSSKGLPHLKTRFKMQWDSNFLYIAAYLEEPNLWASLKNHDDIIFNDNDIEVFSSAFIGTQYESANFNFYYEKVKNWSDSKNNKKIDWIATAKNWMADDMANNKFIDINFNPNAKRINQDRKLTYAEQQAAIRNSY